MPEISMSSAIFLALALGYVYVLFYGETKRLEHIPTIGFKNPILSYISAIHLQYDPDGFLKRGIQKIKPGAKFVKVPGITRWIVVAASSGEYQDVIRAPDKTLSVVAAFRENFHAEFTLFDKEINDYKFGPHIINTKLNRSLGELLPAIHDEAIAAFSDSFSLEGEEWKSFELNTEITNIVGRTGNRLLVGLPTCRNLGYIQMGVTYAIQIVAMTYILTPIPSFMRRPFTWLVGLNDRRVKEVTGVLQPMIDARREGMAKLGANYEKPFDYLTWMMETMDERGKTDRDVIFRMMTTTFASIHGLSQALSRAIFTLIDHPEYIETLREEMERCIEEEGWTKASLDKMHFVDSFLNESQRYNVVSAFTGQRLSLEDCTLAGTFIPKNTMLAACSVIAHVDTSAWGSNSGEFDPYRFDKLEEATGKKCSTMVTTSPYMLTFGHGRHACPGRFFAVVAEKLLFTYLLLNYDVMMDSADAGRRRSLWIGLNYLAHPKARIMLRRRGKSVL